MKELFEQIIELAKRFGAIAELGDFEKDLSNLGVGYSDVLIGEVYNVTFRYIIVMIGVDDKLIITKPEMLTESNLSDLITEYQWIFDRFVNNLPNLIEEKRIKKKNSLKAELELL